jgi:hypothetical protein
MNDDTQAAKASTQKPPSAQLPSQTHAPVPRPILLSILTLLWMIFAAIGMLGQAAPNSKAGIPLIIFRVVILCFLFAIAFSLRRGKYWAWVVVQILWGLNILVCLFRIVSLPTIGIIYLLLNAFLLFFVHNDGVKKFCGVGKKTSP